MNELPSTTKGKEFTDIPMGGGVHGGLSGSRKWFMLIFNRKRRTLLFFNGPHGINIV